MRWTVRNHGNINQSISFWFLCSCAHKRNRCGGCEVAYCNRCVPEMNVWGQPECITRPWQKTKWTSKQNKTNPWLADSILRFNGEVYPPTHTYTQSGIYSFFSKPFSLLRKVGNSLQMQFLPEILYFVVQRVQSFHTFTFITLFHIHTTGFSHIIYVHCKGRKVLFL